MGKYVIGALILLTVTAGATIFGENGLIHIYYLFQEKNSLEESLREQRQKNARLKEEVRRLKEDRIYLEMIARQELGLVKERELIYRFEKE